MLFLLALELLVGTLWFCYYYVGCREEMNRDGVKYDSFKAFLDHGQ